MKRIQDLINRGVITNFTIGKSALPEKGFFCSMRFNALEGYVQGRGLTVEEAFEDTMRRVPQAQPQTRPVTTTFQMPEVPVMRMPL